MKNKRPRTVTFLALLVLSFTMLNAVRFAAAISEWTTLTRLGVVPSPLYISRTGFIWALVGIALFFGIWLGKPFARITAIVGISLYAAYYWFDRLMFQNSVLRENSIFAIFFTLLVVFYTFTTLSLPASKNFMRGKNEQSS
jgi:hypothetical protein